MTFDDLLETARLVPTTNEAREAQRRSFVYGNLKIDNDAITDRKSTRLNSCH